MGLCLAVLLSISAPTFATEGMFWDFEKDVCSWRPRAETVSLRHLPAVGATQASHACLQVTGVMTDGYNYALSGSVPLAEKRWYRLTGWVRVDMVGPDTPMPYFKCEFMGRESGTLPGKALTSKYYDGRIGLWQELSCLFETPAGTVAGLVALEKGTGTATEIRAFMDDVSVQTISEAEIYQQYSAPSVSKALAGVRDVHPRLFLTEQRIEELRGKIETTHAALWSEVRTTADGLVLLEPPVYRAPENDRGQLWQRPVGNALPYLALAYRLTGQTQYLDAAQRWALTSCDYPEWGLGDVNGTDLAAGHQLFGLALVYDWCYHQLDTATRERIRDTLIARSTIMFQSAAKGQSWWHNLYMQNHMWVNIAGLGAAGLAVFEDTDDAQLWIGMAVQKLATTMDVLGPDGASHEGVGYWEYGVEHMLKLMDLTRDLLGMDFYGTEWWQNTAQYSLYMTLPRSSWSRYCSAVNLADSPCHHWYGPDHILRRLAATYEDPYAQWLADQIDSAQVESSNAQWLNLMWYEPSVPLRSPQKLPTLHHFADMGIVSARSDWTGDESLALFKCGPFIGHKSVMEFTYDPGGGHTHPDAGHFVLFANGEWLLKDDGVGPKWTDRHSTLLIDGGGQLGEGASSFLSGEYLRTRSRPRILTALSTPEYDHIAGDATEAYPRSMGLQRFVRHLVFVKPDVMLVLDEVLCESEHQMELRFHPAGTVYATAGDTTVLIGARTVLVMDLLTPADVTIQAGLLSPQDEPGIYNPMVVRYLRTGRQWRNAVAICWADIQRRPRLTTIRTAGDTWEFRCEGATITFDWTLGQASMNP